jgi:alginate O-acetyltransferase complex protein AlgJ
MAARQGLLPQRLFQAALAAMLLLSFGATLWHPYFLRATPVDEHRAPAAFPALSLLRNGDGAFAAQLNRWFDDRVGVRDLFIRTKNQIDYSLFHTSRRVYVGRNGWLFEHGTTDDRLYVERASAGDLQKLEHAFTDLAQRLQQSGIHLVVVGYPDKSMLYPEMLPPQAPHIRRGGNYDKLRAFLAAQPTLTFMDAEAILDREKSKTAEPLYYKTDIHVNQIGSIPVVRAIVQRIAALEGRPAIRWDEAFEIKQSRREGSEARFLALLRPVDENFHYTTLPYQPGRDEPDGHWNIPDRRALASVDYSKAQPFDFEFRSLPALCPERLPGLAVFGNSFSDTWWGLGLHRYFCFVRRARTPIERLPKFVATLPPATKYFIFQYVAAYFPGEAPWLTAKQ